MRYFFDIVTWEQRKLKELAIFNPKDNLPEEFEYVDLESVIGTEMLSHKKTALSDAPSRAQRLAKKGDIFYQTVRPYQKNDYLFDKDAENYVFSTGYAQIRPKINGNFLFQLLRTERFVKKVLNECTGTSYPAINSKDLSNIKVSYTNYKEEQRSIGSLLDNLDNLVALQQRKLDQFKQLKTMCLANMFFNSANHVTKLRFVGFTDNVEKQSFGNTISHKSGTSIEKYFSPKGQYKVISIGSYGLNGEYIDQGIRAVSNEKTNSHLIRKGELSMVLNDKTDGKILGRTLLINKDNEYVVNQRSEIIKPNPALWDTQFAFTYLNGPFRKKVIRIMQGGTQKYINFSSVEKLNVFLPEVQEQQKIGFLFKKIDAIICHHQQKILSLKQIRKFLLQNLFI